MNKVLIKSLKLSNFKGVKEFEITDFNGGVSIYGANETGKTTIFDAFNWLLFGKDSLNSAAFDIKTLTKLGEALHNLEHMVKAVLYLEGGPVELGKIYREKYTIRRGSASQTFTGHTTDHYVNGVPCPQKEFLKFVNDICNEENFKLLTNPRYFNEVLHWTDRRRLLLNVCGDIDDKDVIASNAELISLPDIIGNRSTEEQKKIIKAKQTKINDEIKSIPTRIDERVRSKVEIAVTPETVAEKIVTTKQRKTDAETELATIKAGGGVAEKQKALTLIEGAVEARKNIINIADYERAAIQRKDLTEIEKRAVDAGRLTEDAVVRQTKMIESKKITDEQIKNFEKARDKLRKQWVAKDAEVYTPIAGDNLCPACGQSLPADQIKNAARLALETWNEQRAKALAAIVAKGGPINDSIETLQANLLILGTDLGKMDDNIKSLAGAQDSAERTVDFTKARHHQENETIPPDDELNDLISQADITKLEINSINAGNYEIELAATNELERADKLLDIHKADEKTIENNEKANTRIAELEAVEIKLAQEYEALEAQLFVIETFIRTKVSMLEEKIRRKFKYANFRMFVENINGGLEECCDTTFNGVPYPSLNNGARINIGLDICNTLSDHYGISLPVFIDNSEAVTDLFKTNAQQIRLFVSKPDKILRVEND